jgi:hypothetical protein
MGSAPGWARVAAALDGGTDLLSQTVAVLGAACPDLDPETLPLGEADRLLLEVHERVLGRPLEHTVTCPGCGALTTLPLGRADVGEHAPRSAWCGPGSGLREPTYADLRAARGDGAALLEACRIGDARAPATLDDLAAVEGSLCGPLRSSCAECGQALEVDVDVLALVLAGLAVLRVEVDREVHLLATGYGWDLATIEALPDDRRHRLATLVAEGAR